MFAFRNFTRNFTGFSFVGKAGNLVFEFSAGIVEEVTFNITTGAIANAAEIPENINLKLISKDQFITATSAVVGSKIIQTKLFKVVAGATPNLFI